MPTTQNRQNPAFIDWFEDKFIGLDRSSTRYTISDNGLWEMLNMIPISEGVRAVVPGPTPILTGQTAGVIWARPFQIGTTTYLVWCTATGTLTIFNTQTNAVVATKTGLNGAGTDAAQWLISELLIIDSSGYYSWDPTNGFVSISTTTTGNRIAVYDSRVWIFYQRTVQFTDAGSYNSFGGTGGAFPINDPSVFDIVQGAQAFAGSLYIWSSNAIVTLSNVRVVTQGSAQVANFQLQTMESTIGCPFRLGVYASGVTQMMLTSYGWYNVQGSFPVKISDKLNEFFTAINFSGNISSGICSVYGILSYLFCVEYPPDESLGYASPSYAIFGVTEKNLFWRANFAVNLIVSEYIGGVPVCYAFDANGNLYSLFTNTGVTVQHKLSTKLYNFGSPIITKRTQKIGIGIMPLNKQPVVNLAIEMCGDTELRDVAATASFITNMTFTYVPTNLTYPTFQWAYSNGTTFDVTTWPNDYIFYGIGASASQQMARYSRHLGMEIYGTTNPYYLLEVALQLVPFEEWY